MRPIHLFLSTTSFAAQSSVRRQITTKPSVRRVLGRAARMTAVLLVLLGWSDVERVSAQTPPRYTQGEWGQPFDLRAVAVHMSVMHTGRVLYWDLSSPRARTFVYNPANGAINEVTVPPAPRSNDLFCAGHTFLADGRLLVAGGNYVFDSSPPRSINYTNISNV